MIDSNTPVSSMVERLRAKEYYGSHAIGTVVVVDGQPHHFTGTRHIQEATEFISKLSKPLPAPALSQG